MKVECFGTKYLVILICLFGRIYARKITIPLRKSLNFNKTTEKRDVIDTTDDVSPTYHDNLSGRPGQGYYLAIQIGTPPQSVSFRFQLRKVKMCKSPRKQMFGFNKCLRFFSILRVL